MKKLGIFNLVDILLTVAVVLYFTKKANPWWAAGLAVTAIIISVLARKLPGKVQNDSGKTIMAKPETGSCDPVEVKPGEFLNGIDGVKVDGRVYKAVGGSCISVNENNKIKNWSMSGCFFNLTRGGYLSEAPDDCWKPLFNS